MIDGVKVRKLRLIPDERGFLMEMMRKDWEEFEGFGQVYVTAVYPGVVKAWHYHRVQEDRFTCVRGMVKAVLKYHFQICVCKVDGYLFLIQTSSLDMRYIRYLDTL